jgi:predicted phage terminase large subunit-like protein
VIFRRTTPEIRRAGGLWPESMGLYPALGGVPMESRLLWRFPSGATVQFSHLEYEKDKLAWHGAQVSFLGWDELVTFQESQFTYLLSRLRSVSGIKPYIRATTNPHALSWVKTFFAPWLDKSFPEPAQDGEPRWFIREGDNMLWVPEGTPDAISAAFIHADVYDNPALLSRNPAYLSMLKAQSMVDRLRLLEGDWDAVEGGNMFRRDWFEIRREAPRELRLLRAWDMASSEPKPGKDPDWTVGTLGGLDDRNLFWVLDCVRMQGTPGSTEALVKQTAMADEARYGRVPIRMEQEPGSSGVTVIDHYRRNVLLGRDFDGERATGPQTERVKPLSQAAEAGNVKLLQGVWNHDWLNELAAYPSPGTVHDDQVISAALSFNSLANVLILEFS